MKVKDMIKFLKDCNPDADLFVHYSGYYAPKKRDIIKPELYEDGKEICIAEVETEC